MAKIPSYPALLASALAAANQFVLDHGGSTRNMTVTEMNKYWATVQSLATAAGGGWIYISGSTPTALAANETWIRTTDGFVYKSASAGAVIGVNWIFQYVDQLGLVDIDQGGAEILRSKTIQDIQPFQYVHFNGTSSTGIISDNINLDVGVNDFGLRFGFKTSKDYSGADGYIIDKRVSGGVGYIAVINSANLLNITVDDGSNRTIFSDSVVNDDKKHTVVVLADRDGSLTMYIDGVLQSDTTAMGGAIDISNSSAFNIGHNNGAEFFEGEIAAGEVFNHIDIDAKSLSSNPNKAIDWIDEGGSNVDLISGTVTIGKKYRTNTFIAGDDFSNIANTGASANVTGAEWTATDTTPTTWTNSSVLHQLGATLNLKPQDISPQKWKDSANKTDALFTDVELGNTSLDHVYQDPYRAIADNDTFAVPEGCAFLEILINVTTLQAGTTIRIGTADGGQQVVADSTATTATGMKRFTVIIDGFSAGDTLYIGSDGGAAWAALVADVYVRYQIIKV